MKKTENSLIILSDNSKMVNLIKKNQFYKSIKISGHVYEPN